ncbi:unnamed protein product [Trypanosoma congolense IL3000]|uniref:WGS project CAEQ00000000 data, annotated contig 2401 n=1 Tax=Trypanosoma congolense (strain IL3000) TaxID=1068625 RepID=F9WDS8_TRYCI|nr:unnamed protein product [Trypanosoma congolense IL3000]
MYTFFFCSSLQIAMRASGVGPFAWPMSSLKERMLFLALHVMVHICAIYLWSLVRATMNMISRRKSDEDHGKIEVLTNGAKAREFFSLGAVESLWYHSPPYNGKINTILSALRPNWPIAYNREVVDGIDGNPICLDWLLADETRGDGRGILVILPGLASWSQTNYVQRCVLQAHRYGIHCCVFNCRGLGDTPLTTPRLISASWTGDLHKIFSTALSRDVLSSRFGAAAENIWGAGFSLGGVIMTKFLKECGNTDKTPSPLDAAIIINSPLDMEETSRTLNEPKNAMYQRRMISNVIQFVSKHIDVLKNVAEVDVKDFDNDLLKFMKSLRSLQEFDLYINAPHNGFSTVREFYDAVNVLTSLKHCKIPMLCLIAQDDPVIGLVPRDSLTDVISKNDLVAFVRFPYGGHLGFCKTPLEEWNGDPSLMEIFVCDLISSRGHTKSEKEQSGCESLY